MFERNGVVFFPRGSRADYPNHLAFTLLASVSLGDVRFPFGFFIEEQNGKRFVRPGTEDERTQLLLKAFPDAAPEMLSSDRCLHGGSDGGEGCHILISCPLQFECMQVFDNPVAGTGHYTCACVDRF
ncbi:hypothetical protein [Mycobacterium sp. 852013-50091_SCH5140682]|uniref:hypothetical protein n=1 Tax=Mycobacterium sp. 852013-50091_SCH5140682 TaxID=1834109 RepID=UPI000AC471F9|nr:hypothetical protein [Mycobacterium sp. 852013-50091_SCH5140682]